MTPTNWLPAILVLALAAAGSLIYLLLSRRRAAPTPRAAKPTADAAELAERRVELETRVQRAMAELHELMAERHQMEPERFEGELRRLEQQAAKAMRERDTQAAPAPTARPAAAAQPQAPNRPAPSVPWVKSPQLRGALWGAGVVGFFAVLAFVLLQEQVSREDGMGITGKLSTGSVAPGAASEDPALAPLRRQVEQNPNDVRAAADLGHELLMRQRWDEARAVTDRGLGVDPYQIEHRIHRAVLKAPMGDLGGAVDELEHLASFPGSDEALLFAGTIASQMGDEPRALRALERFAREVPPQNHPPQLQEQLAMLRSRVDHEAH